MAGVGPESNERYESGVDNLHIAIEYIVAIYNDWLDADVLLETLNVPMQNSDGTLKPMSDRILEAVENAKRNTD